MAIRLATGADETKIPRPKHFEREVDLSENPLFLQTKSPVETTGIINEAITKLSLQGGGVVKIPSGEYGIYTIVLKDHVVIQMEQDTILRASMPSVSREWEKTAKERFFYDYDYIWQEGDGGNYLEPEVEPYVGLQDHGHTYFANSLVYAKNATDIGIVGGAFVGTKENDRGEKELAIFGCDPMEPKDRLEPGHDGLWYGNKGIAFVNCENVLLKNLSVVCAGHFSIITEGVTEMLVDSVLVDSNRDAFDVDCCQNVTIRNSVINSLTDDGIVLKASFGAGRFCPTENVLIEDCKVMGYDAGSVYNKTYTTSKIVAEDMCGPTGRIKLGTESTCGYHRVTVRRTEFDRSRGFALEAVDGSPLTDVLFEDCRMKNVSSSPFFLKAGDRGRFPVTGKSADTAFPITGDVRLDQPGWVIPDRPDFLSYPAKRFTPSYRRTRKVTVDGEHTFYLLDEKQPARLNEANLMQGEDGRQYAIRYGKNGAYEPDLENGPVSEQEAYRYANANGSEKLAGISDILIRNVVAEDVDPRYPILLMGMTDSPLERVTIEHVKVTFRGGLTMQDAVEQKLIFTEHRYAQDGMRETVQKVPKYVNPFFLWSEGRLPRKSFDPEKGAFFDDPFNVPELHDVYPEPSNWGILPAFGFYGRHIRELTLRDICIRTQKEDGRFAVVLDDVNNALLEDIRVENGGSTKNIAVVTNHYRRHNGREYLLEEPYFTTEVSNLQVTGTSGSLTADMVQNIEVNAPSPGTPRDGKYPYRTISDEVKDVEG